MFAIFGSGFGLYGYLPAVLQWTGEPVILPRRSRPEFERRAELARFAKDIVWAESDVGALDEASGVVLAIRPQSQAPIARAALSRPGIARIILEKPLAPDPETARGLLDDMSNSGRSVRIGYVFRHLSWRKSLVDALDERGADVSLTWRFMAHHFHHSLSNWKSQRAEGGGTFRFYGIHLVALLAELGYDDVVHSATVLDPDGSDPAWNATFRGPGLPPFHVKVNSRSTETIFTAACGDLQIFTLATPFSDLAAGGESGDLDPRTVALRDLLASFNEPDDSFYRIYWCVQNLWEQIEAMEDVPAVSS